MVENKTEAETQNQPVSYEDFVKQTAAQIIQAAAGLASQYDKKLNEVIEDFAEGVNTLTKE